MGKQNSDSIRKLVRVEIFDSIIHNGMILRMHVNLKKSRKEKVNNGFVPRVGLVDIIFYYLYNGGSSFKTTFTYAAIKYDL